MRSLPSCLTLLMITASFAAAQNESATAVVCKEIVNNACEDPDTTFQVAVGKLWGFSQVVNVPDRIVHVWYYKDRELGRLAMRAPNAPRWRTWSSVTVSPKMIGPWRLEARDASGNILASFRFAVGESRPPFPVGPPVTSLPQPVSGAVPKTGEAPAVSWQGDHVVRVRMTRRGGIWMIPVKINGLLEIDFVYDTGCSETTVTADVVSTMIRQKAIGPEDFLPGGTYVLADGREVSSPRFRIRSLEIGGVLLRDLTGSVSNAKADPLLGQNVLGQFKSVRQTSDGFLEIELR